MSYTEIYGFNQSGDAYDQADVLLGVVLMNKISIQTLALHQFKGINEFTANLNGESATIYGANGSGKSTAADAYLWLLTGKNNAGETFDPFPVDETGKRKHEGQEPTVQAEFCRADGSMFILKRTLVEKRVKKTGHTESTYTGDESKCWIDGVPTKITDYNAFIEREFAPEQILRLLTNLGHFNRDKAEAKRSLLFQTFGDMTDADILDVTPELAELAADLGRKTVADYHKMIKERLSDTCKQLDLLPVRIDEAAKSLREDIDIKAVESALSKIGVELATLQYNVANDKGDGKPDYKAQICALGNRIDYEISEYKQTVYVAAQKHEREYTLKLVEAESLMRTVGINLENIKNDIQRGENRISELEAETQSKRDEWTAKNYEWNAKSAESFVADDESCPTCGQPFPPEKIQEMEANWNERKSEQLSQISKYRDQIQGRGKAIRAELDKCNTALSGLRDKLIKAEQAHGEAERHVQEIKAAHKPYEPDPAAAEHHTSNLNELRSRISDLESQLSTADNGDNPEKVKMQQRISELEVQQAEQQQLIATYKASEEAQKRIDDYSKQQRELGTVRDTAEKMLHLCDEFIRIKAEKVTENINKHFKIVRFVLFEELKNGGLRQVCESTVDGVSFDQMNRARQVAASLDIINTFSQALGYSFPVFIDDSEGVFKDYGVSLVGTQEIRLIATEDEQGLRVEVQS